MKRPRQGRPITKVTFGKHANETMAQIPHEDHVYYRQLHSIVDDIFQKAHDKGLTWSKLAESAGLTYQTVIRLGERETKYPQFKTIFRLAEAVGWKLSLSDATTGRKIRVAA